MDKVLIWTKKQKFPESFYNQFNDIQFIETSYKAELLALVCTKDIVFTLVEIDPANLQAGVKVIKDIRQISNKIPIVIFSKKLAPTIINEIISFTIYDYLIEPLSKDEIKRISKELKTGVRGKENYSLLYNLMDKLQELYIKNDIIKLLNITLELDTILDIIIKKAIELVNVEAASILLFNESEDYLIFNAVYGKKSDILKGKKLQSNQGIAGWVARKGKPLIVNNVKDDKRFYSNIDKSTQFTTRSILCAPIKAQKRIHGVIELLNKKNEDFTNDDLEKIMMIAHFAAFALNKSNLIKNEKRKVEEITLLFEIGTYLSSMLNLDELLKRSVQLIRRSFGFYYIGIALINNEDSVLELKNFDSTGKVKPKKTKLSLDKGLLGWVIQHGVPIRIGDVMKDPRYIKGIEGICSEMVIPLKRKNIILGVIDIGSKEINAFNDRNQILTVQIARLLSVSIENAMLYTKVGRLAIIDDLTTLFNARYCHITIKRLMEEKQKVFSIIFLDMDFFKLVNDQFGHQVGGKLLREIGGLIKRKIEKEGIAIRYGGDEYVIILPGIGKTEASQIAKMILYSIDNAVFLKREGINYHITASLGVASSPEDSTDGEHILSFADRAMYWVKKNGRNGIKPYDSDVTDLTKYPMSGENTPKSI